MVVTDAAEAEIPTVPSVITPEPFCVIAAPPPVEIVAKRRAMRPVELAVIKPVTKKFGEAMYAMALPDQAIATVLPVAALTSNRPRIAKLPDDCTKGVAVFVPVFCNRTLSAKTIETKPEPSTPVLFIRSAPAEPVAPPIK